MVVSRHLLFGGLGIDSLRLINVTLLAKWLPCFVREPRALWHKLTVSKYNPRSFEWVSGSRRMRSTFGKILPWFSLSFLNFLNVDWGGLRLLF